MPRPAPDGDRAARRVTAATFCTAVLAAAGCAAGDAGMTTVSVAAAASLTDVYTALGARYEAENPGTTVSFDFGSSGTLAAQLPERRDIDLFASAGPAAMDTAVRAGAAHDPVTFASNHVVLAVPVGNPAGITGLADLADPRRRVALCDPNAPCGAASESLLSAAGVKPSVDTREPSVRAVLTKISVGEVDAGLVYGTDVAASNGRTERVAVDVREAGLERAAGATDYEIALTGEEDSPRAHAAHAFRNFLLSEVSAAALHERGFLVAGR